MTVLDDRRQWVWTAEAMFLGYAIRALESRVSTLGTALV